MVHPDDRAVALRLLPQRRHELVDLRTQCVYRLHRDLVTLLAGGTEAIERQGSQAPAGHHQAT